MAIKTGTEGDDTVYGTAFVDWLYGGDGNDALKGFGGADRLYGGNGIDTAFYADSTTGVTVNLEAGGGSGGAAEGDRLFSIENLYGSSHDDVLIGDEGANAFHGLNGADTLKGAGGADMLDGGTGDDTLKGGGGADQLVGGEGLDTIDYSLAPRDGIGVVVLLDTNTAWGSDAQGDTFGGIENVTGSAYQDSLRGDAGANILRGMDGSDVLNGLAGNDRLEGGTGNDDLMGGTGADVMIGGAGDDSYSVDDAHDTMIEYAGHGIDTVRASVSYALPAGADIEGLLATGLFGTAAIDLTGNSSGNVVRGNYGNNVIAGAGGNDELIGLGGLDSFRFDTTLNAATNVDVVSDFNVDDDTILLDQDIFSTGLGLGEISAGEFVIGTQALDGNDRIIYDPNTGALSYDNDSAGGNAAVQFATLSPGLALTYLDFLIV
jgi:Ca2+-binding RTX toxin-like protein